MNKRLTWLIQGLAALILAGLFVFSSGRLYRTGYPLDDAWIHQTFARNLVEQGQWAINPGEPTAGSTAPLWTLVLAVGYVLHIPNQEWAYGLGVLCLFTISWIICRRLMKDHPGVSTLRLSAAGLLIVSEWHLVWAAVSGMEILFYSLLVITVLLEITRETPRWWLAGVWIGICIWIRPDGLTLLGPAILCLGFAAWRKKLSGSGWMIGLLPLLVSLIGYLLFNRALSGSIWPNTFAAKQMEYQVLQQHSIISRYVQLLFTPLTGTGIILLPGLVLWVITAIRDKRWDKLSLPVWVLGYVFIYAWKLPVIYQHGRYLMPILPVYFYISLEGLIDHSPPTYENKLKFVLGRAYVAVLFVVPLAFLILGMKAYSQDVAVIESEMVESSKWVSVNTDPKAVIAAHDIGALGYFGQRKILDLAGLINPEIIPELSDSRGISDYLSTKPADYLVMFPDWYQPPLTVSMKPIYSTHGIYSPELGGSNMTIYQITH
jgi:hypothetical protein